jgi:hypothetical protein
MNYEYENRLKAVTKFFYIAAALLLAVGIASVVQTRSRKVLEKTLKEVTLAQEGLTRIKAATTNRRQTLAAIKSQLDQNTTQSSPEMILYRKFDELKARLNADDMTMVSFEKKGGEAALQFALTFNNPDFNALLNIVSTLHGGTFPLTPVSSIAVTQADGKGAGGVTYKITGKIVTRDKVRP